jgi:hypothetical protein
MVLNQPGILPAEMPGQQGAESTWHLARKCQVSMVLSQPGILPAEMPGQQGAQSAWHLASRNASSA